MDGSTYFLKIYILKLNNDSNKKHFKLRIFKQKSPKQTNVIIPVKNPHPLQYHPYQRLIKPYSHQVLYANHSALI